MSVKEKENVLLQQATLNFGTSPVIGSGPSASKTTGPAAKGKKRTLTVANNFAINLSDAEIPVTKEVVEAMRKRILELEEQLEGQPTSKRPKLSNTNVAPVERPKAAPSTSASAKPKTDPKKIDALIKKIWSSLQKEVKTEKYKFRGGPSKTCRIEEVIEDAEFAEIFAVRPSHIKVIQPLPDNKPNSSVYIYEYPPEEIEKIFGKHYKELKGNRYTGNCANFTKSQKIGLVALNIKYLQVTWSSNTMKCGMKFEVEEPHSYRSGLDDVGNDYDAAIYDIMLRMI